jgi:hypothetical protein
MHISDSAPQHRATTLQPSESLDTRTIIAAIIKRGHSAVTASKSANLLMDALEEYTLKRLYLSPK